MKLSDYQMLKWILLLSCTAALFLFGETHQLAQTQIQIPARAGHVNDFAGVVDEKTRLRLANLLENVQQKLGIDFAVVTVPSTAGREIFSFSRQVAVDWNVGARTTTNKSLLLVLAVNEKESFTQFSRSVQGDLPEAVLGEMSQRMKALINAGDFSGGLNAGVHHFVSSMARKLALNVADFETPLTSSAKDSSPGKPAEEPANVKKTPAGLTVRPRIVATAPSPTSTPTRDPLTTDAATNKPVDQPAPVVRDPITIEASTTVRVPATPTEKPSSVKKKPETPADKSRPAPIENSSTTTQPDTTAEDDADE